MFETFVLVCILVEFKGMRFVWEATSSVRFKPVLNNLPVLYMLEVSL